MLFEDNADREGAKETLIDVPLSDEEDFRLSDALRRKPGRSDGGGGEGGSFKISPRELESLIQPLVRSESTAAPWEAQLAQLREQKSRSREPFPDAPGQTFGNPLALFGAPGQDLRELTSSPMARRSGPAPTAPLSVHTELPGSSKLDGAALTPTPSSAPSQPSPKPVFPVSHQRRTPFDEFDEAKSSGRENSVQRFLRDPLQESPLSSPRKILGTVPDDPATVMREKRLACMAPGISAWPAPPPPKAPTNDDPKCFSEPPDREDSVELEPPSYEEAQTAGPSSKAPPPVSSEPAPQTSGRAAVPPAPVSTDAMGSSLEMTQSLENPSLGSSGGAGGGMASSGAETVLSRSLAGEAGERSSRPRRPSSQRRFHISVSPSPSRPPPRPPLPDLPASEAPSQPPRRPRKFVIRSTSREVVSDQDPANLSSSGREDDRAAHSEGDARLSRRLKATSHSSQV